MPASEANAPQQRWFADRYASNARFVADLGEPLIAMLSPKPGERILDLGCGDGALTEKLQRLGADVVAVDSAPDQVAAARARGIDARVADGRALPFEAEFDAILTNAALHWMSDDPDAVIDGMWRALAPGGRIAAEMGGAGNIDSIIGALSAAMGRRGFDFTRLNPWYFPGRDEYCEKLRRRGFRVRSAALIDRPTGLPGDIAGWLHTFAESFLFAVPESDRGALIAEVTEILRPRLFKNSVWVADYVRLRFVAEKP